MGGDNEPFHLRKNLQVCLHKSQTSGLTAALRVSIECHPGCNEHTSARAHMHTRIACMRACVRTALCQNRSHSPAFSRETGAVKQLRLTCQRISTEVVVCGVTERILGASSGAGDDKTEGGGRKRKEKSNGLN